LVDDPGAGPTPAKNPIIPGFHPDPSVCRVGDSYYLATSSFTYFPGVPIFRSHNLVDWEQIGNILDRPSQLDLSGSRWSSAGNFAPTLRHHDGRFWMITTVAGEGRLHNFFVTATDPAGPWSDPVPVTLLGIDPDLCWDDDGACWVHYAGFQGVTRVRIDDATGELLGDPEVTWSGTGLQNPEAPHLLRRGDTWYLLIAEGGTERGHAVSIARGPSPEGPWESNAANPILSHRSTSSPIQNTGHADLVEAPDGTWWMVALGVRPKGTTPGFHVLGRETFLTPVTWSDGWPVVGPLQEELPPELLSPTRAGPMEVHDDFDDDRLAPEWVAVRRPASTFSSLTDRPGWLTITGEEGLDSALPALVARRQQHHGCDVRTSVEADGPVDAGLVVYMDDTAHYEVAVNGELVQARARIGPLTSVVGEASRPPGAVVLVAQTREGKQAPDRITLGFEDAEGEVVVLASLDGRYLSTEVVGGFIGRTIGMYAAGGTASFDWFRYREVPPA
jgi:beta-xylosidase